MTENRRYVVLTHRLELTQGGSSLRVEVDSTEELGETDPREVPYRRDALRPLLADLTRKRIDEGDLETLGTIIGDWLIPTGSVRETYWRARELARQTGNDVVVRVRVISKGAQLADVPWEYAYLPEHGATAAGFLALDPTVSIVRHPPLGAAYPKFARMPARPRFVAVVASAPGWKELDVARERAVLQVVLDRFSVPGIHLDWRPIYERATFQQIRSALQAPATFFHFAGHGGFDSDATGGGQGYVVVFDDNDPAKERRVPSDDLAVLAQQSNVSIVLLGACQSGAGEAGSQWDGVAAALIRRQIPAVVGMQHEIIDRHAIRFAEAFYTSVGRGLTLDTAVTNGRLAIWTSGDDGARTEWGVPALFMRSLSGALFPFEAVDVQPQVLDDLLTLALPPLPEIFVGRETERRLVKQAVMGRSRPGVVISGTLGIGKSALAIIAAHELQDAFLDGVFYVDVAREGSEPSNVVRIMRSIVSALGVRGRDVPEEPADLRTIYRSIVDRSSTLIVLDNVESLAGFDDLLPSAATPYAGIGHAPTAILTSTSSLAPIDPVVVTVGPLDAVDAKALLRKLAGDRVSMEPDAVHRIVDATDGNPLGLTLAGRTLAANPELSVAAYAERLQADPVHRLQADGLEFRAELDVAYDRLGESRAVRLFHAFGALRSSNVMLALAATLIDDESEAAAALSTMVSVGLVADAGGGWYRIPQLVIEYASERATGRMASSERREYVVKAAGFYWGLTETLVAEIEKRASRDGPLRDPFAAIVTLIESQRPVLRAVVTYLRDDGLVEEAYGLFEQLYPILSYISDWALIRELAHVVLERAHTAKAFEIEASLLASQAMADVYLGNKQDALKSLRQIHDLTKRIEDDSALASVLERTAKAYLSLGSMSQALRYARRFARVSRKLRDTNRILVSHGTLASTYAAMGRIDEGVSALEGALSLLTNDDEGTRRARVSVLTRMGTITARKSWELAEEWFARARSEAADVTAIDAALEVADGLRAAAEEANRPDVEIAAIKEMMEMLGDDPPEEHVKTLLGIIRRLGQLLLIAEHWVPAMRQFRNYRDLARRFQPGLLSAAYQGTGEVLLTRGRPKSALSAFLRARFEARRTGSIRDEAIATWWEALSLAACTDHGKALERMNAAVGLLERVGMEQVLELARRERERLAEQAGGAAMDA